MALKNVQHHEKQMLAKLEELSSFKIADNDARRLIQTFRRHGSSKEKYRILSAADMSGKKSEFNTRTSLFFIQNGLYHKNFSSVDATQPFFVIETHSGRETAQGSPVFEIWGET